MQILLNLFSPAVSGGLSTLATVLIIIGSIILVLAIVGMLLCMCLLMRRRYEKGNAYSDSWRQPYDPRHNHGLDENRIVDSHSTYASDRDEEARRMDHLIHVMSQSPYLQPVRLDYGTIYLHFLLAYSLLFALLNKNCTLKLLINLIFSCKGFARPTGIHSTLHGYR